jgi:hypothetical protein
VQAIASGNIDRGPEPVFQQKLDADEVEGVEAAAGS